MYMNNCSKEEGGFLDSRLLKFGSTAAKRRTLLYSNRKKIATTYTHGAGCTYSAAIAAQLARGIAVSLAVKKAKHFITSAIKNGFRLNDYVGAVNRFAGPKE